MAARISHTTISRPNTHKESKWWKRVLHYTDVPGDPNEPGREKCLIVHPRTALALGAEKVADCRQPDGSGWMVLEDPLGNRFCIVRSDAKRAAPPKVSDGRQWPWLLGLVVGPLAFIAWLLNPALSRFEQLLIFIPLAIVYTALAIARAIEWKTTPALKAALRAIEGDRQPLDANEPWSKELHRLRSEYLLEVRAHAERWRTIFSSLLAVFGAIALVGRPQTPNFTGEVMEALILLTVFGVVSGLTAISLAGWAAAAAPKIDWLKQTNPKELRRRIFEHANRSAARLRAALTCGVVALVVVLAGTVVVLFGAQG